jgi:hypothetical protein
MERPGGWNFLAGFTLRCKPSYRSGLYRTSDKLDFFEINAITDLAGFLAQDHPEIPY